MHTLTFARLHVNAIAPTKGSKLSAGWDLYACVDGDGELTISNGSRRLIPTYLSFEIPDGTYGRVAPRSGLACKGIDIGAGVIDADYRGHVKVLVINNSGDSYTIRTGDKIAQLILEELREVNNLKEVSEEELTDTERGSGGFGSTGYSVSDAL